MNVPTLRIIYIALLITALAVTYFLMTESPMSELFTDPILLLAKIRNLGTLGPLLVISLMAVAIVINPLPSAPVALAAGAVYGHTYGTIYIVIGAEVGAIVAFMIARIAGHELANKYLGSNFSLGRFGSQSALTAIVFVSRLIPFMSFDLVSYAAGLTPLMFWRFAIATLLGLIPISFALAHLGGEIITIDNSRLMFVVLLVGLLTLLPLALKYLGRRVIRWKLDNTENRS